jgi:hypothetical protein
MKSFGIEQLSRALISILEIFTAPSCRFVYEIRVNFAIVSSAIFSLRHFCAIFLSHYDELHAAIHSAFRWRSGACGASRESEESKIVDN